MKKLLALVLALVMSMSLVTISNAAYSDAADIDYKEAVDVMSAVGVLEGSDNKFEPKAELTREQAAKIIAYLDLGKTVAEALPSVKVFNDVAADRWSSKFIAYCADAGYIAGVGNGNFDPAGKLTGYAFGKLLLCALGYDATIEEFTGSNWTIKVAKLMESNDITKGTSKLGSAVLTREEAAQYALNALQAKKVDYENKGTNVTINGAVISTGASKASADAYAKPNKTLADVLYGTKLVKAEKDNTDDFGRKATTWTYNSKKVGSYTTEEPILTYTDSLKEKDLFTDLGVDGISGKYAKYIVLDEIWVDGTKVATSKESSTKGQYEAESSSNASYADTVVIAKGDSSNMAGPGKGVTTQIFEVKDVNGDVVSNHYKMVCVKEYLTKITSVTKANATTGAKRFVTTGEGKYETEDFAKNDWVLVTKGNDGIASMKLVTKVENVAVTSYTGSKVTAAGTTYNYSQEFSGVTNYALTSGNTYTFYLDSCGNIIKSEAYSTTSTDYVLVIDEAKDKTNDFSTDKYNMYKVLDMEGKVSTVKVYQSNIDTAAVGSIVTYKADSDNEGYVKFTKVGSYDADKKDTAGAENATIKKDSELKKSTSTYGKVVLNNNTTFVLTTAKNTYKVVKGLSSLDTYKLSKDVTMYSVMKNGAAVVAFVDLTGESASSATDTLVYVVSTSATKSYDAATKNYIYTYKAIVNGELTTIDAVGTEDKANESIAVGLMKITATQDGYAKTFEAAKSDKYVVEDSLKNAAGEVSYEAGNLTIGEKGYVVSESATVYTILGSDDTFTADASLEALTGEKVQGVFYLIKTSTTDDTIATIYFDGTIDCKR